VPLAGVINIVERHAIKKSFPKKWKTSITFHSILSANQRASAHDCHILKTIISIRET
jgi:hypothetical protein